MTSLSSIVTSTRRLMMLILMFHPPRAFFANGSPLFFRNLLMSKKWHISADDEHPSVYRLFDDEPLNFFDAERNCRKHGAHLASFTTLDEFNFIKEIAAARGVANVSDYWLGIYNVGECPKEEYCTYYFTDGTTFDANRWASAIAPRFFQVEENGVTTPVFQDAEYRGGTSPSVGSPSTHIRPHYCHSFREDYVESAQCAGRRRTHVCMATQASAATATVTATEETTTPEAIATLTVTMKTNEPATASSSSAERMTAEWRLADGLGAFHGFYADDTHVPTLEPGILLEDIKGLPKFISLTEVNARCAKEAVRHQSSSTASQLFANIFHADEYRAFATHVCRRARYDRCLLERNAPADAKWRDAADAWWWRNVHCVWVTDAARLLPLSALVLAALAVVLTLSLTACCVARRVRKEKATGDYGVREKHEETLGAEFLDCEIGSALRSPSVRRQSSRRFLHQQKERIFHQPPLSSSTASSTLTPSVAGASPPQFRANEADVPTCLTPNDGGGSYLVGDSHHLFLLDASSHYEEPNHTMSQSLVLEGCCDADGGSCCQQMHYQDEVMTLEENNEEDGPKRNSPPYVVLATARRISTLC